MCTDYGIIMLVKILKTVLDMVHIIGPILLMVSIAINVLKIVKHEDESEVKKLTKNIYNSVIATIILFLIPILLNLTMYILSNVGIKNVQNIGDCWNSVNKISMPAKGKYIERKSDKEKEATKPYIDKSKYHGEVTTDGKIALPEFQYKSISKSRVVNFSQLYGVPGGTETRCGAFQGDHCSNVSTLTFEDGTKVTYYMQYQHNHGMQPGGCVTHAISCVLNTLGNADHVITSPEIQDMANRNQHTYYSKYGVNIKYFTLPKSEAMSVIRSALYQGYPVFVHVQHSICPDIAATHHQLVLLYADEQDRLFFTDSSNYAQKANGKYTISTMMDCIEGSGKKFSVLSSKITK